jgi:hypothetical protein
MAIVLLLLSCKAGNREAYQDYALEEEATADSISLQETFQSDSLSEANLRAFDNRAIQKLHDVIDLIEILSEPKNEIAFRLQAKTMLLENFENPEENKISLILPDIKPFHYSLEQFSDSLMNNKFVTLKLKVMQTRVHRALVKSEDEYFRGTLFLQLEPSFNHKTLYPKELSVEIILKKAKKDFGESTQEVWEVFLGNMGN